MLPQHTVITRHTSVMPASMPTPADQPNPLPHHPKTTPPEQHQHHPTNPRHTYANRFRKDRRDVTCDM